MQILIITRNSAAEIRCRDPEKNGVLSTHVLTHSVGGVAHYSCPRGFYMEGNETRICLQNGSWSGTAPACFCEYFLHIIYTERKMFDILIIIQRNNKVIVKNIVINAKHFSFSATILFSVFNIRDLSDLFLREMLVYSFTRTYIYTEPPSLILRYLQIKLSVRNVVVANKHNWNG